MSGTNAPPGLTVSANGQGAVLDQLLNTFLQGGCLLADLRNFVGLSNMCVFMIGTTALNDGGQGAFVWNSSSTTADDDGVTTIAPFGLLTGRWLRCSPSIIIGPITQALTGHYYQDEGANIDRLADRVFVGDAILNNGNFLQGSPTDWLDTYQAEIGLAPVVNSVFASLAFHPGNIGVLGGAQSVDYTNPAESTIGVAGYAYNNSATLSTGGWAYYGESHRRTTAVGNSYGAELAVVNQSGQVVSLTPYAASPSGEGLSIGMQLDSGNGFSVALQPGLTNASAAITFSQNTSDNSAPFLRGIVALNLSIKDNGAGVHEVLTLPVNYGIQWYNPSSVGTSFISCSATTPSTAAAILFEDGGMEVIGSMAGVPIALFTPVPLSVNYVHIQGAPTGGSASITAAGSDSDVNLVLGAQGAGLVQVSTSHVPTVDNSFSSGGSGVRWTAVWAVNGTIQTSDPSLKSDMAKLPSVLSMIRAIDPISFRWIDGGGGKPGKRTHYGFDATQIKAAIPGGEDWGAYVLGEDGVHSYRPAEMLPVAWKGLQELIDRVERLEASLS